MSDVITSLFYKCDNIRMNKLIKNHTSFSVMCLPSSWFICTAGNSGMTIGFRFHDGGFQDRNIHNYLVEQNLMTKIIYFLAILCLLIVLDRVASLFDLDK